MENKKSLDDLKMIRIFDFNIIPKYLFEQVKGRSWNVDRFLKSGAIFATDPASLLFAYADKQHIIKGFLWATINIFGKTMDGQILSLDKEYWGQGALSNAVKFLNKLKKELKLRKLVFRTSRPRAFAKLVGARPSKSVVMEI